MRYLLFFLLLGLASYGQRYDNALTYLQFIDSHHADVVEQTWNYMYTYTQENDYQKRNGQRKKLENILNRALRYIEKEKPFDKDFQDAAITYLNGNLNIVKENYVALLKNESSESPSVYKSEILKKIRNAMFKLRQDYDHAVTRYGEKYDLNIKSNNSALARQMKHTIQVYDYFNDVNTLARSLKEAEAYLWQDVTQLNPDQFNTRLQDLQKVIDDNLYIVSNMMEPNDNHQLRESFLEFQNYFSDDFENQTAAILAILKAYSINDRTDIVKKTEDYNKAKTWFNINRREAYDKWSQAVQTYLRSEIKPI